MNGARGEEGPARELPHAPEPPITDTAGFALSARPLRPAQTGHVWADLSLLRQSLQAEPLYVEDVRVHCFVGRERIMSLQGGKETPVTLE